MSTTQKPEALRIADAAANAGDAGYPTAKKANAYYLCLLDDCAQMIRKLHAENTTLQAGYAAARLEIESLQRRVQEVGATARREHERADRAMRAAQPAPAAAVLREFAEGRISHLNQGICPDQVAGHDSRDPDCTVCRALDGAAPAAVAGPSEILEKVDTLIASINEAHISKDAEWKRGCFAVADSVYEQIKEMLDAAPTTQIELAEEVRAMLPAPPTEGMVAGGSWGHLKLMMECSAFAGALQLDDALANIDEFACASLSANAVAQTPAHIKAMERAWLWMENQADGQSKGGHATFDLLMLREERDALRAAIDVAAKPTERTPASGAVVGPVAPPNAITASLMRDDSGEQPAFCLMVAYRSEKDARAALAMIAAAPTTQPAPQQEPTSVDLKTMELAESVGLIGPASRSHDLHAAIQRFHDLICANATINAAQMAAEAISEAAPQQEAQEPVAWQSRTRPTWGGNDRPWSPWEPCTKGLAEDCWKTPLLHDWAYEARALYTAPQPSPASQGDALDAERYRWLREQPFDTWKQIAWNTWNNDPAVWPYRDAAIDAARAAQKGGA